MYYKFCFGKAPLLLLLLFKWRNCCIATIQLQVYIYNYMRKHSQPIMMNFNERMNTLLYKNISLTLYSWKGDVSCVWEVSWRRRQTTILTPSSSDHSITSFSFWLGLLNHGSLKAESPLSAAGSHFGILSPTNSNRLCTWLYHWFMSTCFHCFFAYLHRCISWLKDRSRVNI